MATHYTRLTPGTTTWVVEGVVKAVHIIGPGGNSAASVTNTRGSGGGEGGCYAGETRAPQLANFTIGATVACRVPTGGTALSAYLEDATATKVAEADYGRSSTDENGGTGSSLAACIGETVHQGGLGGDAALGTGNRAGGGAGAAAGPDGDGGKGGDATAGGAPGGGGANDGTDGANAGDSQGRQGGNNRLGTGAGAAVASANPGNPGVAGGGGGGGGQGSAGLGGSGSQDTLWDGLWGPGSGPGAAAGSSTPPAGGTVVGFGSGAPGVGSGTTGSRAGQTGGDSLIVIEWDDAPANDDDELLLMGVG